MVGNQVTVAVARRRAEPGDLIYMCAATRIARRPVDVRICMMSGRRQDSSAYHASRANLMLKSASLPLSRWVRVRR
jgi:hypothetical protein